MYDNCAKGRGGEGEVKCLRYVGLKRKERCLTNKLRCHSTNLFIYIFKYIYIYIYIYLFIYLFRSEL